MTSGARPQSPRRGFGALPLIRLALVAAVLLAIAVAFGGFVDRWLRTETVMPFFANGPIHLTAAGEILVARRDLTAADGIGSIDAYDPAGRTTRSVVTGLIEPVAADASPDGTICAIVGGTTQPARASIVQCSSGLSVNLDGPVVGRGGSASLSDIVFDGSAGWIVADVGRGALFHLNSGGRIDPMIVFRHTPTLRVFPEALARGGDRLYVAVGRRGVATLGVADRNVIDDGSVTTMPGAQGSVQAVSALESSALIILGERRDGGIVTYPVGVDSDPPRLVDGLFDPHGMVVLPDGRIAVADSTRLLLVRPTRALSTRAPGG